MVMNPPAGTNIHPKDWMLVQRLDVRMRCLELAARLHPTSNPTQLLKEAESFFAFVKSDEDGGTG